MKAQKSADYLQQCKASPEVQALMTEHDGIVSRLYAPSKQAYIGMSLFYAENADMANFHNAYHPGMVAFQAEAMPAELRETQCH